MTIVEQIFGKDLPTAERDREAPASPSEGMAGVSVSEDAANAVTKDAEAATPAPMIALERLTMEHFRKARDYRRECGIDEKLRYSLLAQTCKFSAEQKQSLVANGVSSHIVDKLFTPVTATKSRAAKAMLIDLVNQGGDPLFKIEPTPMPDTPQRIEDEVVSEGEAFINATFATLQAQGITQLPPDVERKLISAIYGMTDGLHEEASNRQDEFARSRAKRLQRKTWDAMVEGGWDKAFSQYIDSICIYGTGVIIGPVPRVKARRKWTYDRKTKISKCKWTYETVPVFESVNPFDCYPAPGAVEIGDGPLCIRVRYTPDNLWRYCEKAKGVAKENGEGWRALTLHGILASHPEGGVQLDAEPDDAERLKAENKTSDKSNDCMFEGVRCFMSVRGSSLAEIGIVKLQDGSAVKINDFYRVETVVIDGKIVYCRILDDMLDLPVSKGKFYDLPGSWWGESIAGKVSFVQMVQNNIGVALVRNLAAASGPQMWINNVQRLLDKGPAALQMAPYKVWAFQDLATFGVANSGAPMGMMSVPSNASELMGVWERMKTQSDIDSGIPAYTEGQTSGQGGALRTAAGLAMFTEASTRGMKMVMTTTDMDVIRTSAQRMADWILATDTDMSLKGDAHVRAVGLIGRILKAQRDQARTQFFNSVATNPYLQQLIGPKGAVALLRPALADLDVNPEDIIPSESRMKFLEAVAEVKTVNELSQGLPAQGSQGEQGMGGEMPPPEAQGAPQGADMGNEQPAAGTVAERRSVA